MTKHTNSPLSPLWRDYFTEEDKAILDDVIEFAISRCDAQLGRTEGPTDRFALRFTRDVIQRLHKRMFPGAAS